MATSARKASSDSTARTSKNQSFKASAFKRNHHLRHFVVHNYHDYSNEPDDPAKVPVRRRKGGVLIPFPVVLHRMITEVEANGNGSIFGWQPHGRCFLIRQPVRFVEELLPRYFQGRPKLTSFQRQLNLYGFNRITQGPDATAYYHQYFLRDREFLAKRMGRHRIKGTKIKAAASPDEEPNFYDMQTIGPVPRSDLLPQKSFCESSTEIGTASRTCSFNSHACISMDDDNKSTSSTPGKPLSPSNKAIKSPIPEVSSSSDIDEESIDMTPCLSLVLSDPDEDNRFAEVLTLSLGTNESSLLTDSFFPFSNNNPMTKQQPAPLREGKRHSSQILSRGLPPESALVGLPTPLSFHGIVPPSSSARSTLSVSQDASFCRGNHKDEEPPPWIGEYDPADAMLMKLHHSHPLGNFPSLDGPLPSQSLDDDALFSNALDALLKSTTND